MSIPFINAVFVSDLGPYERLVMLALADRADDTTGACYPSILDICARTGMKERGVQNVVKRLIELGVLVVNWGGGRHQRNTYTLKLNPAPDAVYVEKPRTKNTVSHTETPHVMTETPHATTLNPAPDAGEPSITIIEPSVISKKAPDAILGILCEVHGVTEEAAKSFIAYRRKSKAKALTETAAKRVSKNLWEIAQRGGDPNDAMGLAEERGWATAEPDWYFKSKGSNYDNRTSHPSQPRRAGDGSGTIDAFAAVAARHAGRAQ